MSKELEAIKYLNDTCINFLDRTKELYCTVTFTRKRAEILRDDIAEVNKSLQRLEQIDNSTPSEALECVNDLENFYIDEYVDRYDNNLHVIKQALLKAQEQKQYLKWEDLEFNENNQRIKVKLGSNIYTLDFYIGQFGKTFVLNLQHYFEAKDNIQFFNDLHLERVEE